MTRMSLVYVSLLLTACQQDSPPTPASSGLAQQGQAFAQVSCSGCNSIERYGRSPTSAPAFAVIVNQEGVTEDTLSVWLESAHNYPQEMDFYLQEPAVRSLVAYLLTLRDPKFKRPPD
jgi:mono/diheme cytochrome c family protein